MKAKSNKKLGLTSKIFIALICGMILGIVMHYFVPKGHIKDDIIIDGKIVNKNLQIVGVDEKWLKSELKKKNINAIEDVFYAGVDQNKKLTISERYPDNFNPEKKYGIE